MPALLFALLLIAAILAGVFFGVWWLLGLFAAFLTIGVVSIILRAIKERRKPNTEIE